MDQIIDLIFENPFFLIIILGALFSLFGGKKKEEQQEQRQTQQQRTQQPSQRQRQPQPHQQIKTRPTTAQSEKQVNRSERGKAPSQLSIEEQRAKQMARFASDNVTSHHSDDAERKMVAADNRRKTEIQNLASSYNQKRFKKDFKKSLTSEGLINSVIMSEVLGSPRARNPYQSVTSKRRKGQ